MGSITMIRDHDRLLWLYRKSRPMCYHHRFADLVSPPNIAATKSTGALAAPEKVSQEGEMICTFDCQSLDLFMRGATCSRYTLQENKGSLNLLRRNRRTIFADEQLVLRGGSTAYALSAAASANTVYLRLSWRCRCNSPNLTGLRANPCHICTRIANINFVLYNGGIKLSKRYFASSLVQLPPHMICG